MTKAGAILLVGLLQLGRGAGASAQQDWAVLQPDERVRLRIVAKDRTEGLLAGRSDGSSLELIAPSASVRVAQIDSLWVRGRSARPGAVIGSVAGAALFATLDLSLCGGTRNDCGTTGFADALPDAAMLGLIGAIPGALAGALVGLAIPRWRLRYTRERGWAP